jgi:hypothetical protein
MNIEFLSTVAVIAPDPPVSREPCVDALGLPLGGGEYLHSEQIAGCKAFGIWPLSQAAQASSGRRSGRPSVQCRRSASSSTLRTPRRSAQRHGSSSRLATSCCTRRAGSRGVKQWSDCSHRRVRSSGSRISPCFTTNTERGSDLVY